MAKQKYSLWTFPAGPHKSPLGNLSESQLEKLAEHIEKMDWNKVKEERRKKQTICKHNEVYAFVEVLSRPIYLLKKSYHCKDCELTSKKPIGIYKNQKSDPNELENILNTQFN